MRAAGIDVTADAYPYLCWQSTLTVLFPERNFEDRKAAEFALTETSTPGGLLLCRFDPATVTDRATPTDPHALSTGIARVWVNGAEVFDGTAATGTRPGRVLRRR